MSPTLAGLIIEWIHLACVVLVLSSQRIRTSSYGPYLSTLSDLPLDPVPASMTSYQRSLIFDADILPVNAGATRCIRRDRRFWIYQSVNSEFFCIMSSGDHRPAMSVVMGLFDVGNLWLGSFLSLLPRTLRILDPIRPRLGTR